MSDWSDQGALDILTGRRGRPDGFIPGEYTGGGGPPGGGGGGSLVMWMIGLILKGLIGLTILLMIGVIRLTWVIGSAVFSRRR